MTVGKVGRPHGLDGSFHVREPSHALAEGTLLVVAGAERRVERRSGTDAAPLLRLEGVNDREAAAALTGQPLSVAAVQEPLADDEWLAADLVGCEVPGVGTVARVLPGESCDVLEIEDGTLIPLVSDAVRGIDVGARRIEVDRDFLGLS